MKKHYLKALNAQIKHSNDNIRGYVENQIAEKQNMLMT